MKHINIIIFILLFFQSTLLASSNMSLATADSNPFSTIENTGFCDQIILEAFKRINIDIDIVHLTSERSLINANDKIEDGEYVRIQGIESIYNNLVIVPEKIIDYEFVAFSKNKNIEINDWDSLKDYDIGIITGWKILEKNILNTKSLLKVKNANQLFNVLNDDKVEIIIYNKLSGYRIIEELNYKNIHALKAPLATKEMYLYLHKDKSWLIPQLINSLKSIKIDGTYERIKQDVLSKYLYY